MLSTRQAKCPEEITKYTEKANEQKCYQSCCTPVCILFWDPLLRRAGQCFSSPLHHDLWTRRNSKKMSSSKNKQKGAIKQRLFTWDRIILRTFITIGNGAIKKKQRDCNLLISRIYQKLKNWLLNYEISCKVHCGLGILLLL